MDNIPYKIIALFGPNYIKYNSKAHEVRYYCPECASRKGTPDLSGHLYVNTKSLKYHCYRCDYKGVINRNVKVGDSRYYDEDQEKDVEHLIGEFKQLVDEDISKYSLKIPIDKVATSESASKYLLDRGFTYDQMEYYDMRVGNLEQEFGRIVIPNQVYRLVYTDTYSARSYIGQTPKYHNPEMIKKSEIVFNLHRIKEGTPVILVEGALTAVAAGKHAVASLGKTLSVSQASQIAKKHPSTVFVNYDFGAESNSREACRLLRKYLPDTPIYETLMKDDRDAADLSRDEYVACLSNSRLYEPLIDDMEGLL